MASHVLGWVVKDPQTTAEGMHCTDITYSFPFVQVILRKSVGLLFAKVAFKFYF